jgi:glycosyltransferase involved in cell wall biosynthesis
MPTNGHGRLRIAQVAPLYESVPPRLYGGTERIVSYLTEELVAAGHDVTLFASGDSQTSARLFAGCARALRLANCADPLALHLAMVEHVARRARDFDVVHFHIDYLHFPASSRARYRHLTTLHGRLDLPDIVPVFAQFADMPVVSISDAQRAPLPDLAWQATVPHGLPQDLYRFEPRRGDYLAFLGRVSPEKGLDHAIEIARRTGYRLRVAAKIDRIDRDYYTRHIAAMLRQGHVEFLGEIGERDKQELLGGALALVFPINWPEPFGMVMVEAMACGTPVIAYGRGSVPEVLDDGVTGLVCDGVDRAVAAVGRIHELSRAACRRMFEQRFTAARMASDYTAIYRRILQRRESRELRATGTQGEREDHGHDGTRHDDPRGLLDPRDQLASG